MSADVQKSLSVVDKQFRDIEKQRQDLEAQKQKLAQIESDFEAIENKKKLLEEKKGLLERLSAIDVILGEPTTKRKKSTLKGRKLGPRKLYTSLRELVTAKLPGTGPWSLADITVQLMENGYKTEKSDEEFAKSVSRNLKRLETEKILVQNEDCNYLKV